MSRLSSTSGMPSCGVGVIRKTAEDDVIVARSVLKGLPSDEAVGVGHQLPMTTDAVGHDPATIAPDG